MMTYKRKPAQLQLGGHRQEDRRRDASVCSHSTSWPTTLQIFKRGRWCVVGKVIELEREPVLAVAVRNQQGTRNVVSVPCLAIEYAKKCGARWFYWRHDRTMSSVGPDGVLEQRGWLQGDGERTYTSDMEKAVGRSGPIPTDCRWRRQIRLRTTNRSTDVQQGCYMIETLLASFSLCTRVVMRFTHSA